MRAKSKAPAEKQPQWVAKSHAEVGRFFGISRETILKSWKDQWPRECSVKGGYDLSLIAQWAMARQKAPDNALADLNKKRKELEAVLLQQKIDSARREYEQEQGSLIPRDPAEREIKAVVRAWQTALRKLPSKLIPLLGENGPYVAEQLQRLIDSVCNECVDRLHLNGHDPSGHRKSATR